jgi:4-hydroxybenzoate polyprenyltransferase
MRSVKNVIKLIRIEQWTKNAFLFVPLIFSKHLFDIAYFKKELFGFGLFCLVSSLVYIINDIVDCESDKHHPKKRSRPIASGDISKTSASVIATGCFCFACFISVWLDMKLVIAAFLYLSLNVAYSLQLKRIFLLDVFCIAGGFMLRVLAGAYAIAVAVSPWLVICTLFVSLFLAISKRKSEFILQLNSAFISRPSLKYYDITILDQMISVVASGMAISYALYTVSDRTIMEFGTDNLIFTTAFVLFGIFRYFHLTKTFQNEDNPTHLLLSDVPLMVNIAAWFITCITIVYYSNIMRNVP